MNAATFRRILSVAVLALLGIVCFQTIATACPNCKDALAQNDPTSAGLARGYALSIMFMLSMPFLLTAGLGTYFYLLVRQARKRGFASAFDAPPIAVPSRVLNAEPVIVP